MILLLWSFYNKLSFEKKRFFYQAKLAYLLLLLWVYSAKNMKPFSETKKSIGFRTFNTVRLITKTVDNIFWANRIPLGGDQVPLLMLSGQFERHSMNDLANIIEKNKAGILRGLRSLEKRGIIRFQGEATRRKRLVHLTPKGHELIGQVMIKLGELEKHLKTGITATELDDFYKVLEKINANCLKRIGKEGQTLMDLDFERHTTMKVTKR